MAAQGETVEQKIHFEAQDVLQFVQDVLQGNGVKPEHAATIAGCLVAADLRGVDTHG